jgi:hypothetical protein
MVERKKILPLSPQVERQIKQEGVSSPPDRAALSASSEGERDMS